MYQKLKTQKTEINSLDVLFKVLDKHNKRMENFKEIKSVHKIYIGTPHILKITLWKKH
jgi:hypothetical protein